MKKLPVLIFSFIAFSLYSQNSQIKRTNHWYFGDKVGINFTSGTAVADTNGQMNVYAGCSSISDTAGNLLMYTEGQNVWNKNHQIMPNGTGLLAIGTPVQSSIIVPKPFDNNLYYIFTCAGSDGSLDGIRYSIVDMTLNGGLGDVIVKNELLFKPSSEQLGATMHANCQDVWIMGHELNSNKYRAYLLTATGIDTNAAVINDIGNFSPYSGLGLKFSPNGKKMAAQNNWDNLNNPADLDTLDLFDFDNAIGLLSNLIKLPDTTIVAFSFSPDDNLLYVSNFNTERANLGIVPGATEIFQYDISSNNTSIIQSSKTLVYELLDINTDMSDFQLGIDNKIYIANPFKDSISLINNPNALGISCNIQELVFSLDGRQSMRELPNFISSYFNQDSIAGCFYTVGINEIHDADIHIAAYPNPFSVSTTIVIASPLERGRGCVITLHDILGREVTSPVIANEVRQSHETTITINRNNLLAGIYFLNISINNKSYTQKLIITN